MNFHTVKTDDTGLHAIDCDCVTCETGYRPTALERAVGQRALAARRRDEERRAKEAAKDAPPPRRLLEAPKPVTLPTAEQWEELRRLRKDLGK
jgi:hypothetical protein